MSLPGILQDKTRRMSIEADTPSLVLDFQIEEQIMSNWCWAAVVASLNTHYNHDTQLTQGEIVATELNMSICKAAPLPLCNKPFDLSVALEHNGFLQEFLDYTIDSEKIVMEIVNDRPICCQIVYGNSDGHFIVIYGYSRSLGSDALFLNIADPKSGSSRYLSREDLLSDYDGGQWIRTYLTNPNT
jgi:hypothetical protein